MIIKWRKSESDTTTIAIAYTSLKHPANSTPTDTSRELATLPRRQPLAHIPPYTPLIALFHLPPPPFPSAHIHTRSEIGISPANTPFNGKKT